MKKRYLILLSICFFFYSCVVSVGQSYFINLYDENNILITLENDLKEFNVSFFDNSNTKTYLGVDIRLPKIVRDDKEMYEWQVNINIGHGNQEYQAVNFINRFSDASEYMGIKIENKKGRYKPVTIYPLSACENAKLFDPIVIKLEKK